MIIIYNMLIHNLNNRQIIIHESGFIRVVLPEASFS